MTRRAIVGLLLVMPLTSQAQEPDARKLAQEILDKGSKLFDTRDVAAIAASYTADARLFLVGKDKDTGQYQVGTREGRSQVEGFYHELFGVADPNEKTTSRNRVEHAQLVAADLLVVHGSFQPTSAKPEKWPFVQVRVKQGEAWFIQSLRLFLVDRVSE